MAINLKETKNWIISELNKLENEYEELAWQGVSTERNMSQQVTLTNMLGDVNKLLSQGNK